VAAHEFTRLGPRARLAAVVRNSDRSCPDDKTKGPMPSSDIGPFAFAQGDGPDATTRYTSSSTSAAASTGAATGSSTRGGGASKPAGGWMSISA